ncbi:hypothetical protein BDL97_08G019600 [Sphagnum fallax]|nr:hypothetical protein BDL97_08G019600 [Sphagnum fallax]
MSHFQLPQLFLAGIMAMSILVAFLTVPTVNCRIILDTDETVSLSKEAHAISTNGSQMIIHHQHPHSEEPAASDLVSTHVDDTNLQCRGGPACGRWDFIVCVVGGLQRACSCSQLHACEPSYSGCYLFHKYQLVPVYCGF